MFICESRSGRSGAVSYTHLDVYKRQDVVTTTRVLSYAKAQDLVLTLKKFLSSRGDILADVRSNTLIIRDIPSVLPVLDNLLRQLDRKSQQVEIEARVVAANRSFTRCLLYTSRCV